MRVCQALSRPASPARGIVTALALLLAAAEVGACSQDLGGAVDPYPAPVFRAQDVNPASTTYLETLSTQDASGDVLVLYFASFT